MIEEAKFLDIAHGLLDKTNQGIARWEAFEGGRKQFTLQLPASRIQISYVSPPTEFDRVILALCRRDGEPVILWTISEGEPHWDLALDLYSTVERQVRGWDKVLQD